jgi:hypothetical protein
MDRYIFILRNVVEYLDKEFVLKIMSRVCRMFRSYVYSEYILSCIETSIYRSIIMNAICKSIIYPEYTHSITKYPCLCGQKSYICECCYYVVCEHCADGGYAGEYDMNKENYKASIFHLDCIDHDSRVGKCVNCNSVKGLMMKCDACKKWYCEDCLKPCEYCEDYNFCNMCYDSRTCCKSDCVICYSMGIVICGRCGFKLCDECHDLHRGYMHYCKVNEMYVCKRCRESEM